MYQLYIPIQLDDRGDEILHAVIFEGARFSFMNDDHGRLAWLVAQASLLDTILAIGARIKEIDTRYYRDTQCC